VQTFVVRFEITNVYDVEIEARDEDQAYEEAQRLIGEGKHEVPDNLSSSYYVEDSLDISDG
jgi:hypothetical protein